MNDERAPGAQGEDQNSDVTTGDSDSLKDAAGSGQKPKVQNSRELDDARYAALMSRAHSDQARALVDTVTDAVAVHELAAGTRTNKRLRKQVALRSAVERLLADLLQAQLSEKANGYTFRPMRPAGFILGPGNRDSFGIPKSVLF
jgi:hypothetical protein